MFYCCSASRHPGPPLGKQRFDRDDPQYRRLKHKLETEWIPGLLQRCELTVRDLPVVRDRAITRAADY